MNTEEQKKLLTVKSTTRGQLIRRLRQPLTPAGHVAFAPVQNTSRPSVLLRKGDRAWEGRLWEICQTMNKKLIRGRLGGTRWHNTPKFRHSAQEVNETFGQRRFQGLPTEISSTCGRFRAAAHLSAMADVIGEKSAEVIVKWSRTGRMKEA